MINFVFCFLFGAITCFTYLKVRETLFEECEPEAYVILKIMTKKYYKETR